MRYLKKLEGKRIYLSPMNIEDMDTYCKWMNNKEITDRIGFSNRVTTLESERKWLEEKIANGDYQFAIILDNGDSDHTLLGNCGLNSIDFLKKTASLGIFIGDSSYRNKGYGSEAIKLILDYSFNTLDLHNIMLTVYSFNENAIKCYEKIGFKELGKRREA